MAGNRLPGWQQCSRYTFGAHYVTRCWLWLLLAGLWGGWLWGLPANAGPLLPDEPLTVAILPPDVVDDTGGVTPELLLAALEQTLARQGLEVVPRAQVLSAVPAGMPLDFNPACTDAQALGARVGSESYVLVRLRRGERSLSDRQTVVGGTLHLFAVETRTGRLVTSEHLDFIEGKQGFLPAVAAGIEAAAQRFAAGWRRARGQSPGMGCAAGGDGADEALDLRDGVLPPGVAAPMPLVRPRPEPTGLARAAGVTATVMVEVCVGQDGQVREVVVVRWAGYGLEAAVEQVLRATRFRPALRQGKPVAAWFVAAFNFRSSPVDDQSWGGGYGQHIQFVVLPRCFQHEATDEFHSARN
ncbi:TonB family protein [Chloracidobacterium sp. MS 40/45]|uniref:energy transducer TonB n=1 Tax=Chloracidobacterium aggregatum TaxID=2851959 RepID=UPI001B8B3A07|nr:energy transducer TonB [Chloracidobacterium aggregatum]QUV99785.1 TonB family protein [Chloracidobacterium sp. MS 40/45]